jgi:hypothetical protein
MGEKPTVADEPQALAEIGKAGWGGVGKVGPQGGQGVSDVAAGSGAEAAGTGKLDDLQKLPIGQPGSSGQA